ncbi:MAG: SurA N-terminal domain-containing protein [Candidatus Methylacidiphilales bacterium]|nr:SurA N-terminal domain-containing protein [Candidatus Methylacidiphilales bacterium]
MINFLRQQSRSFFIILLVVVGVSFAFFGVATPNIWYSTDTFGSIRGHNIPQDIFKLGVNATQVIHSIEQPNGRRLTDEEISSRTWQRFLLLRAAHDMGLDVDPAQVDDFIQKRFVNPSTGLFDSSVLKAKIAEVQQRFNVNQDRFEEMLRDELIATEMRTVIISPVQVSKGEQASWFKKLYGPAKVKLLKWELAKMPAPTTPSEEVMKKYYAEMVKQGGFVSEKKFQVAYAYFAYPANYAILPEDKKAAVRAEQTVKTDELIRSMAPTDPAAPKPDFEKAAKDAKAVYGITDMSPAPSPAKDLPQTPIFTYFAQHLSEDNPYETVLAEKGSYVIKLAKLEPERQLSYEEARPQIVTELAENQRRDDMAKAGEAASESLRAMVTAGTPFDQAVANLKLTAIALPEFSPSAKDVTDPNVLAIKNDLVNVETGKVSPFWMPQSGGGQTGYVVYIESRGEPAATSRAEFDEQNLPRIQNAYKQFTLQNWEAYQNSQSGTVKPYMLRAGNRSSMD